MLKSEDPISQRRTSAKSFSEVLNENKESKSHETRYSAEENGTNESVIEPIKEKQSKRKSVVTTDPDSKSTSELLENETTLSEENSNQLILNATSPEEQLQPEDHSFEEIENNRNKRVCCACVPEVFYCMSWYFGNIANSILACFRRCGASCRNFKAATSRSAGGPDENYAYFDDNKDAFCTFEDDNITNFNHDDGETATSVTSVAGTYKLVSDEVDVIQESGQNIKVTDKRSSSPKACPDLDGGDVMIDGGDVMIDGGDDNKNYTVEDVKATPTAHDRCVSDGHIDTRNNNCDEKFLDEVAKSPTNDCSDFNVKDVHNVSNFTADEHNQTASFTHDCPVSDGYGGGSDNTGGGGGCDSGVGDFSTD